MDSVEQGRMEKDLEWGRGVDAADRPEGSTAPDDGLLSDPAAADASGPSLPGDASEPAEGGVTLSDTLQSAKDALVGRDGS